MSDHEIYSTSSSYWRDKVQDPNSTLAAAFITVVIVGISMAVAAGLVEKTLAWLT